MERIETSTMKTPEQIRRETVPRKHYALTFGLLGLLGGSVLSYGAWALFHQKQAKMYPQYLSNAIRSSMGGSLVGTPPRHASAGLTPSQLRYELLRYGNLDHRYDAEIIRHGWYPRDADPIPWAFTHAGITALYEGKSATDVLKWPTLLTAFSLVVAGFVGIALDQRYRQRIIDGVQLDGSIIASVDEYNKEVKGDGMRYRVGHWETHK
jgi:hypothetical protein